MLPFRVARAMGVALHDFDGLFACRSADCPRGRELLYVTTTTRRVANCRTTESKCLLYQHSTQRGAMITHVTASRLRFRS